MQSQTNSTHAITAEEPTSELAVPEVAQLANSHDARLRRVLDYQVSSLEKNDPLEANVGSINSGLMHVALLLDETIQQAMESGVPNIERLSRVLPAIEIHLRVTRQVDRFAQLELRAAEARKPKPKPTNDHSVKLDLDVPSQPSIGPSEGS